MDWVKFLDKYKIGTELEFPNTLVKYDMSSV